MSYEDEQYEDETEQPNLVRDLRKQLRAKEKAMTEQAERLAALELASRKASLSQVVSSKGLPEQVIDLIPTDADPEEWLGKYGNLFGAPATQPLAEQDPKAKALADAYERSARIETAASPDSDDLVSQIKAFKNPQELDAFIAAQQRRR